MSSIPVKTTTGDTIGLKLLPDGSGNFLPVINIENFEDFQGSVGPPGPTGPPGFLSPFEIVTKTADYTLLPSDVGKLFFNGGPTDTISLTLPSPTLGLHYYFVGAQGSVGFGEGPFGASYYGDMYLGGLRVLAGDGSTVSLGHFNSLGGLTVSTDSPFASLHLVAISTTHWVATSVTGDWEIT